MSGLAKTVVVLLLTCLFVFVLLALLVMLVLIVLIDLILISGLTTSATLPRSLARVGQEIVQCMIIRFTTILPIVEVVPIPNVSVSCSNTRRCCRSRDFGGVKYHTHMVLYILQ